jgi:fructose-1,6-bisphosphatase/inositol monophosphatase family enzyme
MDSDGADSLQQELTVASALAVEAGRRILRYLDGALEVGHKERGEVVTPADRESDRLIRHGLAAAFPADAIFSEETADSPDRLANPRVWIVDPLDGTSNFVARGDEFSVSVGLAVAGKPVMGAVYNPTRGELFAGGAGLGVTLNSIAVRVSNAGDIATARMSVSRKEVAELSGFLPCGEVVPISSMAYKLARVAAGMEDGVLSKKRRKEWGTCAGTALVLGAGGRVSLLDGAEIRFNRPERLQALGMVAAGPALHSLLLAALRPLLAQQK